MFLVCLPLSIAMALHTVGAGAHSGILNDGLIERRLVTAPNTLRTPHCVRNPNKGLGSPLNRLASLRVIEFLPRQSDIGFRNVFRRMLRLGGSSTI